MAVCQVCHEIFNNEDGRCPVCGSEIEVGKSPAEIFSEARDLIQGGLIIDAEGLLAQAAKKDSGNGEYHFLLGSVRYKLGKLEGALKAWQDADHILPHNPRIEKCLVVVRKKMAESKKKP